MAWRAAFLAVIGIGFVCLSSHGAESLIENPPFKTKERRSAPSKREQISTTGSLNDRFEFRGYIDGGATARFSLHDVQNSKRYFVSIGEEIVDSIVVDSWNYEEQGVILSQNNKKEMIRIRVKEDKGGRGVRPPMFNPVPTEPARIGSYPTPPPTLPKPNQLIEKLRREQARRREK